MLPLRQLVGRLGALSVEGGLDTGVAALAYDARRVVPGALFFAVPRHGTEDLDAIPRAIERGAAAIVCEQTGHVPYRATRIRVANCRHAMGSAAAAFFGHPSRHLQVIVVTGCEQRAAVAYLLYQLLSGAGIQAGWAGSLGCRVGERTLPPLPLDPEALDVQEMLASVRKAGCRTCILELPSARIQSGLLASVEVDALCVTELTPALHEKGVTAGTASCPERFPGVVWKEGSLGSAGPWRLTDPLAGRATVSGAMAVRIESSRGASTTIQAHCRRFLPQSTPIEIRTPQGRLAVRVPLAGRWNLQAAMAAAATALALRVPVSSVTSTLARVRPIPGRLEPVPNERGLQVYVDTADSRGSLERTLRSVRDFTTGRILLLSGCGRHHAGTERILLGEVAAREADLTILTSDNPGWECPEAIAAQVASGFVQVQSAPPRIVQDRELAIRELLMLARPRDSVVLAGKGHRTVQERAGCILPFDDRFHARAALAAFDARVRPMKLAMS